MNTEFLKKVGGITSTNGAEIAAFDATSDRLFVVASSVVEVQSISNTGAVSILGSLPFGFDVPAGTEVLPNSVAVKNGTVAVAYAIVNTTTRAQQLGRVSFYDAATGAFLNSVEVGFLPDMLAFTPDGTKVLVANEGEPNSYGQPNSFDPEGSVSIINLAGGVNSASVQTVGFQGFNGQINALRASGVRIFGPGATVAQDLEPEYIAVAPDGLTAWVTLQENNAIAVLDIATAQITQILPLGAKDHSLPGNGFDASDRDVDGTSAGGGKINIQSQPVVGLYQPDAIASFVIEGQTYYITANEGDARDYPGFNEEARVGANSYTLDPALFPNAATLKQPANLGRLIVTTATGNTDGDGDFDRIEAFGARSFTIWNASGNIVFDSGDQLEQITAVQVPTLFNSDGTTASFDTRSDNKGPEPEGVVVGVIHDRTYAFIGLERTGDVIVYDVTTPTQPQFVQYLNTPEDISVEGLAFISEADSPTGKPLLVTSSEVSRTVAIFEINAPKLTTFEFTNLPALGTASNGQQIFLGGFSGLYFQGFAANGNLKFVTHTDRGPNGEPTGALRPFLLPGFQPEIVSFELDRDNGTIEITKRTGLFREDGTTPLTGLPNLQAQANGLAYTDEIGVDLSGNVLPNDPLGADVEGIVVAPNGNYWLVDEYRPAIYHFDSNGKLLDRFIPKGTSVAPDPDQPVGTFGTEVLPEVYAQRRNNRGFEAVALEGTKLYAFIQSPIDNPDNSGDTVSRNSRNLRILEFDTSSETVTGEYLYLLDNVSGSGNAKTDKIGDAVALGSGKFAVVERDDLSTSASNKLIYEIDLAGATNIHNPANFTLPAGKTIEQLTPTELTAANIVPVSKDLIVNAAQAGYTGVEKLEGLALVSPNTLAIVNDNDFNVAGTNVPSKLGILELPNDLPVTLPPAPQENFTLQLLHFSDQEAGIPALEDAPRLSAVLTALKNQDGSDADTLPDYENTLILSSGDAYIPGAFLNASEQAFGGQGRADILIQNELGVQAIAFGNHEFDLGTGLVANLLKPAAASGRFQAYPGASFPYLSGNLNFAPDANLAPLVTADGQEASTIPGKIAGSTVITVNGERVGVVGATTPTLRSISSPGNVGVSPTPFGSSPSPTELDALAAVIQADVDALLAANPDINKVILLAHMQQISIEKELATRLKNVDIIVAGGSNTRLLDSNDVLRPGDTVQGEYPTFLSDADGNPVAVVNTDGNYKYVGRLVIDFDNNGIIIPESYDVAVSGAYATDAAGVAALGAEALVDPEVQTIVNGLKTVVAAQDGAIFGHTDVFLNGTRNDVRTQETNFGNLSADANLVIGQGVDPTVSVSIKNGGGIRDNIGFITFPPGSTNPNDALKLPPQANPLAGKAEGDISQLDINNSLRFNNGLTLVTLTATQLLQVVEHSVAGTAPGATPGQFAQIGGIQFSFDPSRPVGDRVLSLTVEPSQPGAPEQVVVQNGEVVGNPERTFRVVTLNFLASGGDNYPFPAFQAANPARFNRVDLLGEPDTNGNGFEPREDLNGNGIQDAPIPEPAIFNKANFASFGSEQDALAEYLALTFPTAAQSFTQADTPAALDERIQNLSVRQDTVISNLPPTAVTLNNTVSTLPANTSTTNRISVAEIAITDDGQGTNILSLDGADAANFELEGTTLFLKAGAVLNPGSLSLVVNVDDPTVGTAPDAFSNFTLTVTPVTTPVSGTSGPDDLVAGVTPGFTGINETVFTGAGNDSIDVAIAGANAGNNRINAGTGSDVIFVANGDRVFGSAGDDELDATDATGYRISGGAGDDLFFLGAEGRALGGDGDDQFYVQSGGGNLISGGAGSDQFWIANAELPTAANTILDFQIGTDVIGIQGSASLGISASTLVLTQVGADTTLGFGDQTLAVLKGVQASSLTPSNTNQFIFA
ncbi:MAG: choice-of-anchor I family protein [Thermosynechococcaceae cyanobacterium MS004]|nr:choice-of-anchor I family protein [Thermosynechococcaceae cyanobacterium MS004]